VAHRLEFRWDFVEPVQAIGYRNGKWSHIGIPIPTIGILVKVLPGRYQVPCSTYRTVVVRDRYEQPVSHSWSASVASVNSPRVCACTSVWSVNLL
jgi:hypothetical protein